MVRQVRAGAGWRLTSAEEQKAGQLPDVPAGDLRRASPMALLFSRKKPCAAPPSSMSR